MRCWLLAVLLLAAGADRGTSAPPPKKATPPKPEPGYSKVEVRGTIGQGSEFDGMSLTGFPVRGFLTVKIDGQGEWRLYLDEAAEKVLYKSVGKQVTITGSLYGNGIRAKTINGLELP